LKEKSKIEDSVSIKLYRDGKLVKEVSPSKESRLRKILKFLATLLGVEK